MPHARQIAPRRMVAALGRRATALELRAAHRSYREIAAALAVSESTARNYVKQELAKVRECLLEQATEVKTLELERLDRLGAVAFEAAIEDPAPERIRAYLKVLETRARLLDLFPRPIKDPLMPAVSTTLEPRVILMIPANGRESDVIEMPSQPYPVNGSGNGSAAALSLPPNGRDSDDGGA